MISSTGSSSCATLEKPSLAPYYLVSPLSEIQPRNPSCAASTSLFVHHTHLSLPVCVQMYIPNTACLLGQTVSNPLLSAERKASGKRGQELKVVPEHFDLYLNHQRGGYFTNRNDGQPLPQTHVQLHTFLAQNESFKRKYESSHGNSTPYNVP